MATGLYYLDWFGSSEVWKICLFLFLTVERPDSLLDFMHSEYIPLQQF